MNRKWQDLQIYEDCPECGATLRSCGIKRALAAIKAARTQMLAAEGKGAKP